MRPTPIVAFNCRNIINLPLPNVDIYYNGEIFKEVIFYDGRILPQYYISNYGRVYSVYSQKLKNTQIDKDRYFRVHISYEKNKYRSS